MNDDKFHSVYKDVDGIMVTAPLIPHKAYPLDQRCCFSSEHHARAAARDAKEIGQRGQYFFGMKVCVDDGTNVTWYTICRDRDADGNVLGGKLEKDSNTTVTVDDIVKGVVDENGQWYTMVYSDGSSYDFCIPPPLSIEGHYYLDVDESNNLILHYQDGSVPPNLSYKDGMLYLQLDDEGFVKKEIGYVKGDPGAAGNKIVEIKFVEKAYSEDEGFGNRYRCIYNDGTTTEFIAPAGDTPRIGENGHWFLGDQDTGLPARGDDGVTPHIDAATHTWFIGENDTGIRADALCVEGHYYVDVDENNNLILHYQDGSTPPNLIYEDGKLYLQLDDEGLVKKELGYIKGDRGPAGSKLVSIEDITEPECLYGNRYKLTYDDGTTAEFVAPRGESGLTPHIDEETRNWFIGNNNTGVRADALSIEGNYYIDVDENNNLVAHYVDGTTPPNVNYDPTTGALTLELDGKVVDIGNIKGEQGPQGPQGEQGEKGEPGTPPHIDEASGNWFIGDEDTRVRANALMADWFYIETDEAGNIILNYSDYKDAPPDITYDEETGVLSCMLGGIKTDIGQIKGVGSASNLEHGSSTNSVQQIGSIAGSKAYKIDYCFQIAKYNDGTVTGQYRLPNGTTGIEPGMKYVACTSEMNAVGGKIISVSNNTVTVDGYLDVKLNGSKDNFDTGDVYDYLIIVDHPELGEMEVGYGAVSFGDGSIVYSKNGFSSAKNGRVYGKYGRVGGIGTKAGHAARADGSNTRALGACSSTDGSDTEATGHSSHAGGVGTRARQWGQHVVGRYNANNSSNDIFIVGCGVSDSDRYNCFAAGFTYPSSGGVSGGIPYIRVGATKLTSTELRGIEGSGISGTNKVVGINTLSNYAKKSEIPSLDGYAKTSDIPDVSKFITEEEQCVKAGTGSGSISLKHDKNTAKGKYSASLGEGTNADFDNQTVVGRYSKHSGDGAVTENDRFIVGGGGSDTERRNCFAAGFYGSSSYIKVGGAYLPATLLKGIEGSGISEKNKVVPRSMLDAYAKTSDIPTVAAIIKELSERISIEADGTVYLITED